MSMTAYRLEQENRNYEKSVENSISKSDVIVDFEAYCIEKNIKRKNTHIRQKKGISVIGGIIAAVVGFLAAAGFTALLPVEAEKAVFIMYVMWIFCGGVLACLFDEAGI